jgi:hypothetical protein
MYIETHRQQHRCSEIVALRVYMSVLEAFWPTVLIN